MVDAQANWLLVVEFLSFLCFIAMYTIREIPCKSKLLQKNQSHESVIQR